jgi:hypothetical protein
LLTFFLLAQKIVDGISNEPSHRNIIFIRYTGNVLEGGLVEAYGYTAIFPFFNHKITSKSRNFHQFADN